MSGSPHRKHLVDPGSPLGIWRHADPRVVDTRVLLAALSGLHILHEPGWRAALEADVSAAIGIALRNLIHGPNGRLGLLDVAMSAVLVHAARGDATANLVLEHIRKCI